MKPRIHIPDCADSGRRAYRLQVDNTTPLIVRLGGDPVRVDNFSTTGLAFFTETQLTLQYYPGQLKFRIGTRVHQLDCTLQLVRKSGALWCANFSGLSVREQRLLSEFISWYQAETIRNKYRKV
ncbi:hypothetical protein [Marinobacterium marinum]|uniref:PilZ domain-containing protein n=1 Tax=Marinobacterium marinum TaxID=2756129 RepID=A0A7W1WZU5_9GAMM|nr:hypothetical protein [Marinobacterium marinum]MBA4503152.1 hypothetical protein [Marinobacterium marinum]